MEAKAVGSHIEMRFGEDEYRLTKAEAQSLVIQILKAINEVLEEESQGLGINVGDGISGTSHMGR